MSPLEAINALGHEEIVVRQDPASGYRAIIALHSTALGPATGGTRLWSYDSFDDALLDALRLSRGMTYKNAIAGLAHAQALAYRLRDDIGVRLIDILDYISLPEGSDVSAFLDAGWEPDASDPTVLRNATGLFPAVLARGQGLVIGFKVEYVHEFVAAQGLSAPVEGAMHAPFRRVRFAEAGGVAFDAIERRGSRGFEPDDPSAATLRAAQLHIDFAHMELEPLPFLRRAGLWCGLHGESMLESGINHLECMYDHTIMGRQLEAQGVRFMQPFSDFPHLYQALTEGEWWPVDPALVDALEAAGYISAEQAEGFRLHGSIGSHLENLERNEGLKGFNQPGIDGVLRAIDPRKNLVGA